jgi:hypothetical protein
VSSAWPAVSLVSSTTVLDPSANTGTLSATVAGAYGNIPAGQAVALSASGAVSCSGTLMPGFSDPVTPGAGGTGTIGGIPLYLVTDGGSGCVLILTLSESGSNFHGGPNSSNLALPALGVQYPTPTVTADLQETSTCAFCVSVTATTALEAGTTSVGGAWTTTVQSTDGIDPVPCSETSPLSPADGGTMTAAVDMSACVENFENEDGSPSSPVTVNFSITVSWTYLGVLSGPVPDTGPPLSTGPVTPPTTTTTLPPGP